MEYKNIILSHFFKDEIDFIKTQDNGNLLLQKLCNNLSIILNIDYSLDYNSLKQFGIKKLEGLDDNNFWESAFDTDNRLIFKKCNEFFEFYGFLGHLCGLYNKNFNINNFEMLSVDDSRKIFNDLFKISVDKSTSNIEQPLYRLSCSKETSEYYEDILINETQITIPDSLMDSYMKLEEKVTNFIRNEKIKPYVYPVMIASVQLLSNKDSQKLFQLFTIKSKNYPTCLKLVMAIADRLDIALSQNNEYLINYYSYTLYRDIERVINRTENSYKKECNRYFDYDNVSIKHEHIFHYNKLNEIVRRNQERRVYLDVPYKEKNEAKSLGAKWDKDQKCWYIRAKEYTNNFDRWEIVESKKTVKHENILDDFDIHNKSKDHNKEKNIEIKGPKR